MSITPATLNAQGTAQVSSNGLLWIHSKPYLIPDADAYPASSASLIFFKVPGYSLGLPSDLFILTSNRGYVKTQELEPGDTLLLTLTPVNGQHPDSARPPGAGITYQVTNRFLALRVEGGPAEQTTLLPPFGASYVTWTPTLPGDPPPNTDSTPIDQIACLCLLPGVLVSCPDALDLTDDVTWVEDTP